MTRQQLINNVIADISKEENISEQEVTTYSVMLRLADMQVKNCDLASVVGRSEQLLCECCEDNVVEEQRDWCNECLENPSRLITK